MDRGVFAVRQAVKHQATLGEDGHTHEDDGNDVELLGIIRFASTKRPSRFHLHEPSVNNVLFPCVLRA
jgi:hypothetical protein